MDYSAPGLRLLDRALRSLARLEYTAAEQRQEALRRVGKMSVQRMQLKLSALFSFLVGNEDMHLKNFSLITRAGKVAISPAYDFLNTTLALPSSHEELALPLNGKKSKLTRNDFLQYFARERLQLNEAVLAEVLTRFREAVSRWRELLAQCFLSAEMKQKFLSLLEARAQRCLS